MGPAPVATPWFRPPVSVGNHNNIRSTTVVLGDWLDQYEQLAGLLARQILQQQFQAAYDSLRPPPNGVPIHRLRRLLQWPRERFDAVLETLRAEQAVDLEALTEQAVDGHVTHDSYHVHGQCYGRLRWR